MCVDFHPMRSDRMLEIVRRAGGTVTSAGLIAGGARWEDLYRLRDGAWWRVSRGMYRVVDAPATAHLDLVAVCRRAPAAMVCLNSAASFWDLTDEMPDVVDLAVPRGAHRPQRRLPADKGAHLRGRHVLARSYRAGARVGGDDRYQLPRADGRRPHEVALTRGRDQHSLRCGAIWTVRRRPASCWRWLASCAQERRWRTRWRRCWRERAQPQRRPTGLQRLARAHGRTTQQPFELYVHERFLARLATRASRSSSCSRAACCWRRSIPARHPRRRHARPGDRQRHGEPPRCRPRDPAIELTDGVVFAVNTSRSSRSARTPNTRASGCRPADLGGAVLKLRLDLSFGDPVDPQRIDYPTLLDDRPFRLLGYPLENVIAEKAETMMASVTRTRATATTATSTSSRGPTPSTASRLCERSAAAAEHRDHEARPLGPQLHDATRKSAAAMGSISCPHRAAGLPERFAEVVDSVVEFVDGLYANRGLSLGTHQTALGVIRSRLRNHRPAEHASWRRTTRTRDGRSRGSGRMRAGQREASRGGGNARVAKVLTKYVAWRIITDPPTTGEP